MRYTRRYDNYITGRDVYLNASLAFLIIGGFGPTKDKPRLALHNGCGAS
jgi:hypothetical protein